MILEPKKIKPVTASTFPPFTQNLNPDLSCSKAFCTTDHLKCYSFIAISYCIRFDRKIHVFPSGSVVKNLPSNARDVGLIPGLGRSSAEGNGNPLQYSCLENRMDRGAWQATVHGVAKRWTWLSTNATLVGETDTGSTEVQPLGRIIWCYLFFKLFFIDV